MNMQSCAQMAGFGEQLESIKGELRKIKVLLEQLQKPPQAFASAASAPSHAPKVSPRESKSDLTSRRVVESGGGTKNFW